MIRSPRMIIPLLLALASTAAPAPAALADEYTENLGLLGQATLVGSSGAPLAGGFAFGFGYSLRPVTLLIRFGVLGSGRPTCLTPVDCRVFGLSGAPLGGHSEPGDTWSVDALLGIGRSFLHRGPWSFSISGMLGLRRGYYSSAQQSSTYRFVAVEHFPEAQVLVSYAYELRHHVWVGADGGLAGLYDPHVTSHELSPVAIPPSMFTLALELSLNAGVTF